MQFSLLHLTMSDIRKGMNLTTSPN